MSTETRYSSAGKSAFLAELQRKLKGLPESEIIAAVAYYDEYLSDAGFDNEAAAIAELGSPAEVAAGILGDYVYADTTSEEKSTKKGLTALWLVVVGLLASPIALPIAIVLIALIFALLVTVLSVVFSLFVAAIAMIVGGVLYLGTGLFTLFFHFASGIMTIGYGLVATALGCALMAALIWLTQVTVNGLAQLGAKILQRNKARKGGGAHAY